jgi:hypothetical protein
MPLSSKHVDQLLAIIKAEGDCKVCEIKQCDLCPIYRKCRFNAHGKPQFLPSTFERIELAKDKLIKVER